MHNSDISLPELREIAAIREVKSECRCPKSEKPVENQAGFKPI
jgi:hypothetical protein